MTACSGVPPTSPSPLMCILMSALWYTTYSQAFDDITKIIGTRKSKLYDKRSEGHVPPRRGHVELMLRHLSVK